MNTKGRRINGRSHTRDRERLRYSSTRGRRLEHPSLGQIFFQTIFTAPRETHSSINLFSSFSLKCVYEPRWARWGSRKRAWCTYILCDPWRWSIIIRRYGKTLLGWWAPPVFPGTIKFICFIFKYKRDGRALIEFYLQISIVTSGEQVLENSRINYHKQNFILTRKILIKWIPRFF